MATRRQFLAWTGASLCLGAAAQPPRRIWRIGLLHTSSPASANGALAAFKEEFRRIGYAEGRDYVVEVRAANNEDSRFAPLAEELVAWKPDVLMANVAGTTLALKSATSTIPIVMVNPGDPIGSGLVESLARPGGNVTGMSNSLTDIAPKHLDLIREILPQVTRVAVLHRPQYPSHTSAVKLLRDTAPRSGIQIAPVAAESVPEIEAGFISMAGHNAQAVIVVTDPLYSVNRARIAELALKAKLPSIGYSSSFAEAGLLIGYGANVLDFYRRAAGFVDRIIKGARPRDMPVEQPTTFELAINLKTARAIGITIPQSTLIRANTVIQ